MKPSDAHFDSAQCTAQCTARDRPVHVQTVDLVMVDFIALEAVFSFKERGRFVKGPYALIPLSGPEGAADTVEFLERLKGFMVDVRRCEDPRQAASLAMAVLKHLTHEGDA